MLVTIQQRDRLEQGLGKEEMKHFTGSKLTTEDLQGVAHVLNVNFQVATLSKRRCYRWWRVQGRIPWSNMSVKMIAMHFFFIPMVGKYISWSSWTMHWFFLVTYLSTADVYVLYQGDGTKGKILATGTFISALYTRTRLLFLFCLYDARQSTTAIFLNTWWRTMAPPWSKQHTATQYDTLQHNSFSFLLQLVSLYTLNDLNT